MEASQLNSLHWRSQLIIMGRKERADFGVSHDPLVAGVPRAHLGSRREG